MLIVGLTGSIGMGKSTTARLFAEEGAPVHDSDAAVHTLYSGEAAAPIETAFPGVTKGGVVDRKELGMRVLGDAAALARLEAIVHPLVRLAQAEFLAGARRAGASVAVLDIPLLFETGRDADLDRVVVVTADPETQRGRVLARPGMTEETFRTVLARQTPDSEKRRRADFVIANDGSIEETRAQVRAILARLRAEAAPDA